jgi:tetratricopeptide (TPR) repeat protein
MTLFMKKILVILFFLISSGCLFSQSSSTDWTYIHNLTIQGIDYLYNMEFDKAENKFKEIKNDVPNDPRGYFFNAIQYYFLYSIERKREYFDKFFEQSEKVISICEKLIDQNENDYTSKFYLAGIYGYRGLLYQIDNSILKAVWDGKKGFSLLKQIVKEKPDMYDAYLGTGLFDYLLSKIPKSYSWVLSVLGYGGDLENGIKELKTAEEKGTYTKQEARFYLSQFLFFENRNDEAFYYIKKLIKEYPENSLFLISYANMESRIDKPEFAIEPCKKAIEINKRKKIESGDDLAYIVLANAQFILNDFKSASDNYEVYLQKVSKQNFSFLRNYNFIRMGLAHDFSGKRDKAIAAYKCAKNVDKDKNPSDALIYARSNYFINHPPGECYKQITTAANYLNRKKDEEALREYLSALNCNFLNEDEKISCFYNAGKLYLKNNRLNEAQKYFEYALNTKPFIDKSLLPYTLFKLGTIYAQKKDYVHAKESFNKARNYEDYYFENDLRDSIKVETKKID